MVLDITCTDSGILMITKIIKSFFYWLQIIGPILAMISLAILITKSVTTNDSNNIKKYQKNIINSLIAMAMLFFLPYLMDMSMQLIGNKTSFTSCWNSIDNVKLDFGSNYIKTEREQQAKKEKATKAYTDTKDYHGKVTTSCLDLTCTSRVVKAQFSCDTLKIVEKHLYDLNAQNFHKVINSYGGFDKYAKSIGGIFGEYYGQKIEGRTEKDFQIAAEYVLGWMYMYGWDYAMPGGRHVKWGGKHYAKDAFYANSNYAVEHCDNEGRGSQATGMGTNFDGVISTENQGGSVNKMASACGDLEVFIYNKLNINRKKQLPKVSRLRDLKVGDCLFFGEGGPKWDKYNEKTWYHSESAHNVVIGEVYSDHVVIYDGGSHYPSNKNYKRNLYFPKEDTEAADDQAVKTTFGYSYWGIRRWYNFKPSSC